MKSTICRLLQAKHLVIIQEKEDGVKMVLSYRLQQKVNVELHMIQMLKQFPLQLGKAVAAGSSIDVLNPNLINGGFIKNKFFVDLSYY